MRAMLVLADAARARATRPALAATPRRTSRARVLATAASSASTRRAGAVPAVRWRCSSRYCTRIAARVDAEAPRARDVMVVALRRRGRRRRGGGRSRPSTCPWRPAARALDRRAGRRAGLDARHGSLLARHGRASRASSTSSGAAWRCVTDALSDDWRVKGARLVRFDAARGRRRAPPVALQASFLGAIFNRDGWLDFWGASPTRPRRPTRAPYIYVGTADPWASARRGRSRSTTPCWAAPSSDADADGCEDVPSSGRAGVFAAAGPSSTTATRSTRATAAAGSLANRALGSTACPTSKARPTRRRASAASPWSPTSTATAAPTKRRGQLPGAFPDTFVRRARGVRSEPGGARPTTRGGRPRARGGPLPWDDGRRGALDLHVFNLWHDDWRGRFTDRSYRLATTTDVPRREELCSPEAPSARRSRTSMATAQRDAAGHRHAQGSLYTGPASLWRGGREVWHDARGWLRLCARPRGDGCELDGAPDLVGDGRVLAQPGAGARRWIGFVFVGRSAASGVSPVETDRDVAAFALSPPTAAASLLNPPHRGPPAPAPALAGLCSGEGDRARGVRPARRSRARPLPRRARRRRGCSGASAPLTVRCSRACGRTR